MSESSSRNLSLEQLRKRAKDLLRRHRAGDPDARALLKNPNPKLADAQFAIARDLGFESWGALKRAIEKVEGYVDRYQGLAQDIAAASRGDQAAVGRLALVLPGPVSSERILSFVAMRLDTPYIEEVTLPQAQLFVARIHGFGSWDLMRSSLRAPKNGRAETRHGLSPSPPFYRIDWGTRVIELLPPTLRTDWEEVFRIMGENGLAGIRSAAMDDATLIEVSKLDFVTHLQLEGSSQVTNRGLRALAEMPQLRLLNLTGAAISDEGVEVLGRITELREFYLYHHRGVSDKGLASLQACEKLERVDLLGTTAGDGVLQALAGKPNLRHLKSGDLLTDDGLAMLGQFPAFRSWQGGEPEIELMAFDTGPTFLLLRGHITDQGLGRLRGLDGLFALNLDDSRLRLTSDGVRRLAALPHLGWLGFDAKDDTMRAIAELPRLRMLMCQDTEATDEGFAELARSKTLEYLWGRRCYGLSDRGFRALSKMPALRGLSVSCKNVSEAALGSLPEFPTLQSLMPMDFTDEGFCHVGRCEGLRELWCMYCRETGDLATEHIVGLPRLQTYYAGQTRITDRTPELLSRMESLERIFFYNCGGVTDAGITALGALPKLRELTLSYMPQVTRFAAGELPPRVRVTYES